MRHRVERLERLLTRRNSEDPDGDAEASRLVRSWSSSYWSSQPDLLLRLVDVVRADLVDDAGGEDTIPMPPSLLAGTAAEADFVRDEYRRWAETAAPGLVEMVRSEIDERYKLADTIRAALSTCSAEEQEALEAQFASLYESRIRELGPAAHGLPQRWK